MQQATFDRAHRAKTGANHHAKRLVVLHQQDAQDAFAARLADEKLSLCKSAIELLQINLGKMCNLTCAHCHVEAGPNRTEHLTDEILDILIEVAKKFQIRCVDLTGGAPEMCPAFRRSVESFRELGAKVMVRSNLTILLEPGYEDMIDFLKEHRAHIVASLPCYSEQNVDAQRGDGVFRASIQALQELHAVGYGVEGSGLILDLVYNPGGPSLPGPQKTLERAYKEKLKADFGISFNSLYVITNLPIGRFYSDLKKQGKAECYDELLRQAFNPATISHLMCKNTLNISWDGWVYDCDFNQMIELPMRIEQQPLHVRDILAQADFIGTPVQTGNHCFGCTAGSGSSCGGELLNDAS